MWINIGEYQKDIDDNLSKYEKSRLDLDDRLDGQYTPREPLVLKNFG